MNSIEIIIGLLLLFMAVPDVCRRVGRPALVFPVFVVFGLALGPMASAGVKTMLHEAGVVGFLLLLFQVGLEIDLPRARELLPALRFALPWALAEVVYAGGRRTARRRHLHHLFQAGIPGRGVKQRGFRVPGRLLLGSGADAAIWTSAANPVE